MIPGVSHTPQKNRGAREVLPQALRGKVCGLYGFTCISGAPNCGFPVKSVKVSENVYFLITPQAIRSPEFPEGSVFMSSAWA